MGSGRFENKIFLRMIVTTEYEVEVGKRFASGALALGDEKSKWPSEYRSDRSGIGLLLSIVGALLDRAGVFKVSCSAL